MAEILLKIIGISAMISIPSRSILLGLNAGRTYFKEVFGYKKILLKYTAAMFIIVPSIVIIFSYIFGHFKTIWIVVLVISLAPASPGMIKNITKLKGDFNISTTWMIMTMFFSLIFLPLYLLVVRDVLGMNIELGIKDVAFKLCVFFILPMGIGFLISSYLSGYAGIIKKILSPLTMIASLSLVVCLLILAVPIIISKGIMPVMYLLIFIIAALTVAHLMSTGEKEAGPILPYSIVMRLPAPAIILIQINHTLQIHLSVIITYSILSVLVMMVYSKFILKNEKTLS